MIIYAYVLYRILYRTYNSLIVMNHSFTVLGK